MDDEITIDYAPGAPGNAIVALLLCPGRSEYNAVPPHPAAGVTGAHLQDLMHIMQNMITNSKKAKRRLKPNDCVYDSETSRNGIMIANVFKDWYGKGSPNGRTPPHKLSCEDIVRLKRRVMKANKSLVLCFGDVASEAWDIARKCDNEETPSIVVKCCHVGNKGLNSLIDFDEDGVPIEPAGRDKARQKENTRKRLTVLANYIVGSVCGDIKESLRCYVNKLGRQCECCSQETN